MKQSIVTDSLMGDAPYRFGAFDAEHDNPCVPENFFVNDDCIVHYTLGYVSIKGESDTTRDLIKTFDSASINKTLTPMEFEVCYADDIAEAWHPIQEVVMRPQITSYMGDPDTLIRGMKAHPGAIVETAKAKFRHVKEEPANA